MLPVELTVVTSKWNCAQITQELLIVDVSPAGGTVDVLTRYIMLYMPHKMALGMNIFFQNSPKGPIGLYRNLCFTNQAFMLLRFAHPFIYVAPWKILQHVHFI